MPAITPKVSSEDLVKQFKEQSKYTRKTCMALAQDLRAVGTDDIQIVKILVTFGKNNKEPDFNAASNLALAKTVISIVFGPDWSMPEIYKHESFRNVCLSKLDEMALSSPKDPFPKWGTKWINKRAREVRKLVSPS